MSFKLDWQGEQVIEQIAQRVTSGVTRFNEQIVADAQQELYPGHGVVTGRLKSSIRQVSARRDGNRVIGTVGAYGVSYSLLVHERYYPFILNPLMRRLSSGMGMITQA
jgi:hypothetical protein